MDEQLSRSEHDDTANYRKLDVVLMSTAPAALLQSISSCNWDYRSGGSSKEKAWYFRALQRTGPLAGAGSALSLGAV